MNYFGLTRLSGVVLGERHFADILVPLFDVPWALSFNDCKKLSKYRYPVYWVGLVREMYRESGLLVRLQLQRSLEWMSDICVVILLTGFLVRFVLI